MKNREKWAKKSRQIFFRFTKRIDNAMTLSVVSASRVYILPKPHLSLARLNFLSTYNSLADVLIVLFVIRFFVLLWSAEGWAGQPNPMFPAEG